jgi:hypothetical protein
MEPVSVITGVSNFPCHIFSADITKQNFPLVMHIKTEETEFLSKIKHPLYGSIRGPEGSRRLRLPDFETIGP